MADLDLTFVKGWRSWSSGERASFSESVAQKLIAEKYAVPFGEAVPVKKDAPPASPQVSDDQQDVKDDEGDAKAAAKGKSKKRFP